MAVELPARRRRDLPDATTAVIAEYAPGARPATLGRSAEAGKPWPRPVVRMLEAVPGAIALLLISTLIWGFAFFPSQLAVALLVFYVYWLWKSWTIGYHVIKGVVLMRRFQRIDWAERYRAVSRRLPSIAWQDIRHVVIIPNYKESESKLRDTLRTMAEAEGATESIIPVLAMEEAEDCAHEKASRLLAEFRGCFYDMLVTYHPQGLPGEVRGKSSNEAWAARRAVEELVDRRGLNLDHLTVTSCDADTLFPRKYFSCLAYHFGTDPKRYRRFWQAPIFFYNNIWKVPLALRVPNALAGLVHLSRLSRKRKVLFSQSTYSLSMRMAHDVGYWDTNIIPEDWHMFLKCYYRLGGNVDVVPIHLPLGNDGALSQTTRATYVNQYLQVRRWAWGASDFPIFLKEVVERREISWHKRVLRLWYLFENHLMWSTQWFFVTLGGFIPFVVFHLTNVQLMPEYFQQWSRVIMTPCLLPYVVLIVLDARLRPPAPRSLSLLQRAVGYLYWLAVPVTTFFFSALPALDSQIRLMLGKRMEYRVTEKV